MNTYTNIIYHIIFATKNRVPTLYKPHRESLFKIIWTTIEKNKSHPYYINGIEDHIHIATHLHPSVSLANLVREIKLTTSKAIKNEGWFPLFEHWQEGYGAFTHSLESKEKLIHYIINQEEHHKKVTSKNEFIGFLQQFDVDFKDEHLD